MVALKTHRARRIRQGVYKSSRSKHQPATDTNAPVGLEPPRDLTVPSGYEQFDDYLPCMMRITLLLSAVEEPKAT